MWKVELGTVNDSVRLGGLFFCLSLYLTSNPHPVRGGKGGSVLTLHVNNNIISAR